MAWLATIFPPAAFFDEDDQTENFETKQKTIHDDIDGCRQQLQYQKCLEWEMVNNGSDTYDGESAANLADDENGVAAADVQSLDGEDAAPSSSTAGERRRRLNCRSRLTIFCTSPMMKFRYHLISYFVFLGMFSHMMLENFHEEFSIQEYVLIFWVASLFSEEVRQFVQGDSVTMRGKFDDWFSDYWNRMDVLNLVIFLVGEVLRLFPSLLNAARVVLCINLLFFYVRVLNSFLVVKSIGPKLLMIGRMMVDLFLFIGILLIFLLSYGVASQAILYPDLSDPGQAIRGILYRGYFQVFGELSLSDIEGPDACTYNATEIAEGHTPCPHNSWAGLSLLAIYMLISNVLLLNLLIAMFSYTFNEIQENTDAFWKYHRYELIKEYIDKPFLVPPFIIISHMITFAKYVCSKSCTECRGDERDLDEEAEISLMHWESLQLESVTAKRRQASTNDTGMQVQGLTKQLETISSSVTGSQKKMDTIEQQVHSLQQAMDEQLRILRNLAASKLIPANVPSEEC